MMDRDLPISDLPLKTITFSQSNYKFSIRQLTASDKCSKSSEKLYRKASNALIERGEAY